MVPGRDYIGIGVGAMAFDSAGRVFLARRGPAARNESGSWEFPGGMFDHLLPDEAQHWISATYLAKHVSGTPEIREPAKCSEIGWFGLSALPAPLSRITQSNMTRFLTEQP